LVQNAAEAAGRDGRVTIRAYVEEITNAPEGEVPPGNGYAVVEIADNGPGMDRKFIEENLFQPLDTTKRPGFGIGAYQALYLVRDMGGRLDVQSEIGRGTRMIVRLPIAPPLVVSPGPGEFSSVSRQ
jgi:signal transduction histidine kinase